MRRCTWLMRLPSTRQDRIGSKTADAIPPTRSVLFIFSPPTQFCEKGVGGKACEHGKQNEVVFHNRLLYRNMTVRVVMQTAAMAVPPRSWGAVCSLVLMLDAKTRTVSSAPTSAGAYK